MTKEETMHIALICTGDELLKGATVNTNLAFLGGKLLEIGIIPEVSLEIPDSREAIREALDYAFSKADTVLLSGGLGPTDDDRTKSAVAEWFGVPLIRRPEAEQTVRDYWKNRHSGIAPIHWIRQAEIPEGAQVLPNGFGSAPGIRLNRNGKTVFLLPGPPSELQPMFERSVLPLLTEREEKEEKRVHTALFRIVGIGESEIEDRLEEQLDPEVSAAYCASPGMVKVFLTSGSREKLEKMEGIVRDLFQKESLPDGVLSLPQEVLRLLGKRKILLATAESCTGGLIAEQLTEIPGSSEHFLGGVVSYANDLKMHFLGVSRETLEQVGAVSRECAEQMVNGIAERTGADAAISVTGIAGPGGGSPEKPVGLVYIGVRLHAKVLVLECHFPGSRSQIRARTAAKALHTLRTLLLESAE